ncbi:MAG TPA: hypothetical protein ENI76_05975 [Ignavibacteria bacterium]|nr:hypothetical protein [Ignavibacteria bacterium]
MKEKVFMNSECLTEKQIIHYKENNLSSEELRKIEKHLIDCPLCSDAIEGTENVSSETIMNDFAFVKKKIAYKGSKRTPKIFVYSAVAALLLIAVTVLFNISRPSNNEQIFNNYFTVYPDVTVHKRGTSENSKLTNAMNFYNLKQYKKALSIFSEIDRTTNNETAAFYTGVSLMTLDKINEAVERFLKISISTKNNFYYEANWYAALGLINMNKTDEAKTHLSKLNSSSDYREKAKEILEQLSKTD